MKKVVYQRPARAVAFVLRYRPLGYKPIEPSRFAEARSCPPRSGLVQRTFPRCVPAPRSHSFHGARASFCCVTCVTYVTASRQSPSDDQRRAHTPFSCLTASLRTASSLFQSHSVYHLAASLHRHAASCFVIASCRSHGQATRSVSPASMSPAQRDLGHLRSGGCPAGETTTSQSGM